MSNFRVRIGSPSRRQFLSTLLKGSAPVVAGGNATGLLAAETKLL